MKNRVSVLVAAASYAFAVGYGIWLARPACQLPPSWIHGAMLGALGVAAFCVLLVPLPDTRTWLARLPLAAGVVGTTILVRALAFPLFPGLDWNGPDSFGDYAFNVEAQFRYGYYFGSCSGLLGPNDLR